MNFFFFLNKIINTSVQHWHCCQKCPLGKSVVASIPLHPSEAQAIHRES